MNILLLNAGSSSLKFSVMDARAASVSAGGMADWSGSATHYEYTGPDEKKRTEQVSWRDAGDAVRHAIGDLEASGLNAKSLAAVGHRWVHGGHFTEAVRITAEIRKQLESLADLAPLHNPPSLHALTAAQEALPDIPHVAVFDTAFHATLPPHARTYAIPLQWTRDWGLRRYGFHGLSYAYCSQRASEMLGKTDARLVICHLGQGCSAAAVHGGQSVDTTMGFTPLDGLVMATRSGSVDPGLLLHAMRHHGLSAEQVETVLNEQSGLLGISGISGDMREVQAAAHAGNEPARLALVVYCHRLRQTIAALAASMGGLDAIVFTGGVGEHSAEVRRAACGGLEFLGIRLDPTANMACKPDADIGLAQNPVRVLVIAAREDLTMLREVKRVVGA